jgi:DNA primase
MPLSVWFIRAVSEGKAIDTAEGRAALVAEAKPLLSSMLPGALRLQLIGEVANVSRMSAEDVESLFGLSRWRRLPAAASPRARRTGIEVSDLKARVLRWLILFPELARGFEADIRREADAGELAIDHKLREVLAAATRTGAVTTGAAIQALGDSEHLAEYEAIAAQGLAGDDDAEAAQEEVAGAFSKLALQRLEARRSDSLARYQAEPSEANLREYQRVDREYARARAGGGT